MVRKHIDKAYKDAAVQMYRYFKRDSVARTMEVSPRSLTRWRKNIEETGSPVKPTRAPGGPGGGPGEVNAEAEAETKTEHGGVEDAFVAYCAYAAAVDLKRVEESYLVGDS
jgi:transposase-like protein